MYKSSFFSLLIVLIIPLLGYLLLYISTYKKIQMPEKHFVDTIIIKTEKGKTLYDTIFHKIQSHILVVDYTSKNSLPFYLNNTTNHKVTLFYIANNISDYTYQNLKKLAYLKKQLKIDSFIHIICFVNTILPDSFLQTNIQFIQIQDTVAQKKFFNNELKLDIHKQMLPFAVLVDKQQIVRNYYLLDNINEEQLLLDIILLNLEKNK